MTYSLFTQRAILIIQDIPYGQVLSYGQVARLAGSPRAARQVVRILHTLSERHQLPWHRVVNSKMEISLPGLAGLKQQSLLAEEGVHLPLAPQKTISR